MQAVYQVTHLSGSPDEGALNFRNGNLAVLDPAQQGFDQVLVNRVLLR